MTNRSSVLRRQCLAKMLGRCNNDDQVRFSSCSRAEQRLAREDFPIKMEIGLVYSRGNRVMACRGDALMFGLEKRKTKKNKVLGKASRDGRQLLRRTCSRGGSGPLGKHD